MNLSPEVILYLVIIVVSLVWRLFFSKKLKPVPIDEEEIENNFSFPDKTIIYEEPIRHQSPLESPFKKEPLIYQKERVKEPPTAVDLIDTNEQKNNPYAKFSYIDHRRQIQKEERQKEEVKIKENRKSRISASVEHADKRLISLNKSNLKKAVLYKELLTPKYF